LSRRATWALRNQTQPLTPLVQISQWLISINAEHRPLLRPPLYVLRMCRAQIQRLHLLHRLRLCRLTRPSLLRHRRSLHLHRLLSCLVTPQSLLRHQVHHLLHRLLSCLVTPQSLRMQQRLHHLHRLRLLPLLYHRSFRVTLPSPLSSPLSRPLLRRQEVLLMLLLRPLSSRR
jgi:hypothetical protein